MLESQTQPIGTVESLWRYPVKSMQGEQIFEAHISSRGLVGDRAYALIETETGHVVSAKHARKWGQVLQCRAVYLASPEAGGALPPILITMPDGRDIRSDDPEVNQVLSRTFGREVSLVQQVPAHATREANRAEVDDLLTQEVIRQEPIASAAAGTFFDYAPLHILTTSTLARLKELYPMGEFDVRRFRPNLVISPTEQTQDFIENTWLGQHLRIGDSLVLKMIDPTPRCVVTTLPQADLPHQVGILKTIAQNNAAASVTQYPGVMVAAVAGVYGTVQTDGLLSRGAAVEIGR